MHSFACTTNSKITDSPFWIDSLKITCWFAAAGCFGVSILSNSTKKISELTSQNQLLATLKQQALVDPDIFISQTNKLTEQLRAAKLEKERLMDTEQDENIAATRDLMDTLESGPEFLADFDAELFGELIDRIIVESNECLRFRLKNGVEFKESIERAVR